MLKGLTASMVIHRCYRPARGDAVLVHAAASGVGLLLVQWLKHLGATVIGTVGSREKAQAAHAAGCEHVVLYREMDFAAASNADWLGCSAPLPTPAATAAANACQGRCAAASPAYPAASATPPPTAVARAPTRSITGPAAGDASTARPVTTPMTAPATPRLNPRPLCR